MTSTRTLRPARSDSDMRPAFHPERVNPPFGDPGRQTELRQEVAQAASAG